MTGDFIDGGAGADVILGDNGSILRTGSDVGPRFRVLDEDVIYFDSGAVTLVR